MTQHRHPRVRRWLAASLVVLAAIILIGAGLFVTQQGRLTTYIEGPAFRAELDKQTSKGLHFEGQYEPLKRTGWLSVKTDGFSADEGEKAFQSLKAKGITGQFNPLGVFLRRWQIDSIHIDSAVARIQVYEPKPQNKPKKPWYALFMPDRVYLKEVRCDKADILWKMKKRDAGFVNAKVLVTPHDRDFEYRLNGGEFIIPSLPKLPVDQVHILITKEKLSLYELALQPKGGGFIHVEGQAGLKEDKSMSARLDIDNVSISPWIPTSWGDQVKGRAFGEITLEGPDQKFEKTKGKGEIRLSGARVLGIPLLDYAAAATMNKSLENIELDDCMVSFRWKGAEMDVHDIRIEARGHFLITGAIQLTKTTLSGELTLGVSDANLEWLPKAKEEIFTKKKGGYNWTTIKLSGSPSEPQNDLAPRLAQALRRSPVESTGLFFREIGEWIQQTLGGD